ncbi:hypothetical protein CSUB01_03249 [Colletotrichum sublineola]|uniref:Uncharacterized protein n=1 Tax=Colletotrichum sublineola TaxID=1173701 RepID=A0A066XBL3_COLSU|nr:hypothetical protein CSUB01_03249 [Colletotrichum sublineola]
MPYYARTKGRTQEIPPDGSRTPGSRSPLPPRPSFGESPVPTSTHFPNPLILIPSFISLSLFHVSTRYLQTLISTEPRQNTTDTPRGHRVSSRSLPDLSADVRAALETPKHDDVTYRHSVWTRCQCCRPGRGPLALLRRFALVPLVDALQFLEEASESVPPVMPALVAAMFLLVALPLLIAWDYL